jgi:hypothetical protein
MPRSMTIRLTDVMALISAGLGLGATKTSILLKLLPHCAWTLG